MKKLLIIALLLTSTSVFAASKGPSWDFFELSYIKVEIDDTDFSPNGFGLGLSTLLTDDVFLFASYADASESVFGNDVDISSTSIGLGYRIALNNTSDFAVGAGFAEADACIDGFGCEDDNGYLVTALFATRLVENLELSLGAEYVDIADESSTALSFTGSYFFSDRLSLGLGWANDDDVDTLSLNLKLHF